MIREPPIAGEQPSLSQGRQGDDDGPNTNRLERRFTSPTSRGRGSRLESEEVGEVAGGGSSRDSAVVGTRGQIAIRQHREAETGVGREQVCLAEKRPLSGRSRESGVHGGLPAYELAAVVPDYAAGLLGSRMTVAEWARRARLGHAERANEMAGSSAGQRHQHRWRQSPPH